MTTGAVHDDDGRRRGREGASMRTSNPSRTPNPGGTSTENMPDGTEARQNPQTAARKSVRPSTSGASPA